MGSPPHAVSKAAFGMPRRVPSAERFDTEASPTEELLASLMGHSFVIISSRFRMARAVAVQAARRAVPFNPSGFEVSTTVGFAGVAGRLADGAALSGPASSFASNSPAANRLA